MTALQVGVLELTVVYTEKLNQGKKTSILFDHSALVIITFKGTLPKMPITLFIIAKNLTPISYPTVEELRVNSNVRSTKFANDSDLI